MRAYGHKMLSFFLRAWNTLELELAGPGTAIYVFDASDMTVTILFAYILRVIFARG
jgi:hypothetical protein